MDKTTQYVDEYAVLTRQMARLKSRAEELKAYFERLAVADLKDTKLKTMEYMGSKGGRVTVSMTQTPKLDSGYMLSRVLGNIADDYVQIDRVYTVTAACKRLLTIVCQGNYTDGSLKDTIQACLLYTSPSPRD